MARAKPISDNPIVAVLEAARGEKMAARAAHRRYTIDESRALDETRWQLREGGGLAALRSFLNHRDDWDALWGGSLRRSKFAGEPFHPLLASELQGMLQAYTREAIEGRQPFPGPVDITLTYRVYQSMSVEAVPADDDLHQFLLWILLEAVRTGDIRKLALCRCGAFFERIRTTRQTCSEACKRERDAELAENRRQSNRRAVRKWAARNLGTIKKARR